VSSAEPFADREALVAAIAAFLAGQEDHDLAAIASALRREIDASPGALAALNLRLASAGADWDYFPPDPLSRRIHHIIADRLLPDGSAFIGVEHVAAVAGKPVVMLANHLSYSDANLLDVLIERSGAGGLADRMTVICGPKVYSSTRRRFSSLCFGTIKVAQSSARSSEDAVMPPREVARAARRCIAVAHERLCAGDALLVFAEGARSRTGGMQPLLPAAARYVEVPGTWILPVAITGTEAMFPVGDERLHPVAVVARAGSPFPADALHALTGDNRRLFMDTIGLAIADLLPEAYRGVYAAGGPDVSDARRVLAGLRESSPFMGTS
jgi:1-acyl-sn-glycerol-3-phosphate acyltransferase